MIFGAFERMVAWRYLRARRQEGFISVIAWFSLLGIALGVATLIIVMSVMNGFRYELLSRILGLNGHFGVVSAQGALLEDYDGMLSSLGEVPGVIRAAPSIEAQALITLNGNASGAIVRGITPDDLATKPVLSSNIIAGNLGDFEGFRIAIGKKMAERLGLGIGDSLPLISPRGQVTPMGTIPRTRSFSIALVFDVGMSEYDSNMIFMPLSAAQAFFGLDKGVTGIEVMVKDPDSLFDMRPALMKALGERNVRIYDWQQSNSSFFTALQVERNVMFLILTLIILVAAFNIVSSLIMLVKDKGRDIAILRTMGATRGMIMRIFFLTGASVGVVGTIGGFFLGLVFVDNIETIRQWIEALTRTNLFSAEIYFLSHLPARLDWNEVLVVSGMGVLLSFAATIYPSWRAARLDPVEALRYE
ncbi:MAG TPA: lipoprotein-releasing ABC transporter permease subunit [Rhodospirillaceae bacterium]|nr:MAG: multidrug ABC transporter substrate-binding protein [Alphaproteobacteria bacterium GWF2_58_20]HAU29681.1 lipoprotein-releasing ABC transporter permease subunit [Rhodospirillaceae bacterium]